LKFIKFLFLGVWDTNQCQLSGADFVHIQGARSEVCL